MRFLVMALWLLATPLWGESIRWSTLMVNRDGAVLEAFPPQGEWPGPGDPRFVASWPSGWQGWFVHLAPDGRWETLSGGAALDVICKGLNPGDHSFWLVWGPADGEANDPVWGRLERANWKTRDALVALKSAEWRLSPLARAKTNLPISFSGTYRGEAEVEAETCEVGEAGDWFAVRYDWTW